MSSFGPSSRNSPGRMWPTRAYSFRLVAIMGTTKISPHRSPWRLGGHRPRHLAKPFVGRSGFASGRGSRPARSPLGPNLRHEAASLQNLEHVRGERIETVDPRYFPAIMWSVEISSPNVQTRPRKCRCIRRQENGSGTINLVSLAGVDKPRDPSPAERSHTFRGSVISPWIADAVTVQGEARYTWACGDPIRPG